MLSRRLLCLTIAPGSAPVFQSRSVHHHKERHNLELFLGIKRSNPAKANRNTHLNEKLFRKARGAKLLILDLPDDVEIRERENMNPNELRMHFLKKGINPFKDAQPRTWSEHQSTMQSFYGVIDPYVPNNLVEKDPGYTTGDKRSVFDKTKDGASHRWHTFNSARRIKKKEGMEKFDPKKFGPTAELIYTEAHNALMSRDKERLHKLVTEHAFVKMWPDVENGSVFWELVQFNEPSKVFSVRCSDNPHKSGNDIAQVIVKMSSIQKLAIYDRFGKLLLGSETEEKSIVEYVSFENHIAVYDSQWRLHEKVYPDGIPPKQGPLDVRLLDGEPADETTRPTKSKPIKLRTNEKIKQELYEKKDDD